MDDKDETIWGLQDCKQDLENEVSGLQILMQKSNVEKSDGVSQTTFVIVYDVLFDDIVGGIVHCKKHGVDGLAFSHALLATNVVFPLDLRNILQVLGHDY